MGKERVEGSSKVFCDVNFKLLVDKPWSVKGMSRSSASSFGPARLTLAVASSSSSLAKERSGILDFALLSAALAPTATGFDLALSGCKFGRPEGAKASL